MDKIYFSDKNVIRIQKIVGNSFLNDFNINLNSKHYDAINSIMIYIFKKIRYPSGMNVNQKLLYINKQTISICYNKLKNIINKPVQQNMMKTNDVPTFEYPESTNIDTQDVNQQYELLNQRRKLEYSNTNAHNKNMNNVQQVINKVEENEDDTEDKYNLAMEKRSYGSDVVKTINNIELNKINDLNNAYTSNMIIQPQKIEYVLKNYYVTIDSQDRNSDVYEYPNRFQVKFSPTSDQTETFVFKDLNGSILYSDNKKIKGDGHGANLSKIFKNIYSISCLETILPHSNKYVSGIFPTKFNGPQIDRNKAVADQFTSYPYGPVNESGIGVRTSILNEPYLIVEIDELNDRDVYFGTNKTLRNAFAKIRHDNRNGGILSSFIQMRTIGNETKIFDPPIASLDKITLNIKKHSGEHYDFGTDKLYIQKFEEYPDDECKTIVTIIPPLDDCPCSNKELGHSLIPGNILFFYDKLNCTENKIKFYDYVTATIDDPIDADVDYESVDYFILSSQVTKNSTSYYVNFQSFMELGDYIIANDETLQVIEFLQFDNNIYKIKVSKPVGSTITAGEIITNFGFYRQDKRGINVDNKNQINSKYGIRVYHSETYESLTTFVIDFPFSKIPARLQTRDLTLNDNTSEIFFLKKKLQISYTLKITCKEKQQKLNSMIT